MSELEDLRRKKMDLFKQQAQSSISENQEFAQQFQQLENGLKQVMTVDALSRYSNVKLAHPETALQALVILAQLLQSGNTSFIDDAQLKNVLLQLSSQKKQTRLNLHGAI